MGLQYTWHHRDDQEEGDRRHLQARGESLTAVMTGERVAMGSLSSPWPRLTTLVGATPEDVVDSDETFDKVAIYLMMGLGGGPTFVSR